MSIKTEHTEEKEKAKRKENMETRALKRLRRTIYTSGTGVALGIAGRLIKWVAFSESIKRFATFLHAIGIYLCIFCIVVVCFGIIHDHVQGKEG